MSVWHCFKQCASDLAPVAPLRTALVNNEENILTVVAALSNALWLTRNDDSGHATRADKLALAARKLDQSATSPPCR